MRQRIATQTRKIVPAQFSRLIPELHLIRHTANRKRVGKPCPGSRIIGCWTWDQCPDLHIPDMSTSILGRELTDGAACPATIRTEDRCYIPERFPVQLRASGCGIVIFSIDIHAEDKG